MVVSSHLITQRNDLFEVSDIEIVGEAAVVNIISRQKKPVCPVCQSKSDHLHSYYYRKVKDMPAFSYRVLLRLKSRKFYCDNSSCRQKIFAERYADCFMPYHRVSNRLSERLLKIALVVGGNAGAKLCNTLNIPVSSSTLIRQIHRRPVVLSKVSGVVGIDDWAFRKGRYYGTAIVDLKKRQVVDLLPDREASTVEAWLRERPHIKIVSRDRFSQYCKGVTAGLPHADQVADRWHLIKNLGEALEKVLIKARQELRRKNKTNVIIPSAATYQRTGLLDIPDSGFQTVAYRKSVELFEQVQSLHKKGITIKQIARSLHLSRITIRKYLRLNEAPRKNEGKTNLQQYLNYIQRRMEEASGIDLLQLWKEITAKGYNGSRSTFYQHLKGYAKKNVRVKLPKLYDVSWYPSKVCILLYKHATALSPHQRRLINRLKKQSAAIAEAAKLTNDFKKLVQSKKGNRLKNWVAKVNRSAVDELKGFANGLLHDYQAVRNAIRLKWSNGQVEGQINKLKTVKRQMYGRASFGLLRKKMLFQYV